MREPKPKLSTWSEDRRLWLLFGSLAVLLLGAFWSVCQKQVASAELRYAGNRFAHAAMEDCLRYVPGATPISCAESIATRQPQVAPQSTYAVR